MTMMIEMMMMEMMMQISEIHLKYMDSFEFVVLVGRGQLPPLLDRDPCIEIVHYSRYAIHGGEE